VQKAKQTQKQANSKWIIDLNVKFRSLKLPRR
jgi:hypothetical protein